VFDGVRVAFEAVGLSEAFRDVVVDAPGVLRGFFSAVAGFGGPAACFARVDAVLLVGLRGLDTGVRPEDSSARAPSRISRASTASWGRFCRSFVGFGCHASRGWGNGFELRPDRPNVVAGGLSLPQT
jgi:hypothetical protein